MRVYMCGILNPKLEEAKEELLNIAKYKYDMKEKLSEKDYNEWVILFYEKIRQSLNLPNKLLSISLNKDKTKAEFIFFDKEPDGKCYKVFSEKREDGFTFYIDMEDE